MTAATLTDRQRVELAVPTVLLHRIVRGRCFSCFDDTGAVIDAAGEAKVKRMRELLTDACRAPLGGLDRKGKAKIARRIERVAEAATHDWADQSAVRLTLGTFHAVRHLIETDTLLLVEGSPVAEAVDLLLPMAEHGLEDPAIDRAARKTARRLIDRCRAAGLYPALPPMERDDDDR